MPLIEIPRLLLLLPHIDNMLTVDNLTILGIVDQYCDSSVADLALLGWRGGGVRLYLLRYLGI